MKYENLPNLVSIGYGTGADNLDLYLYIEVVRWGEIRDEK